MRAISQSHKNTSTGGLRRGEIQAASAEVAALFLIFIVAFTGRDRFGDNMKLALILLSVIVGGIGAGGGLIVLARGVADPRGRLARLGLGAFMIFAGVYSIVHVLS